MLRPQSIQARAIVFLVLVSAAFVGGRTLALAGDARGRETSEGRPVTWDTVLAHAHVLGERRGRTTLVVFSDYQCPSCRLFQETLTEIRLTDPQALSVFVVDLPLAQHPFAVEAAVAANCSERAGRYEALHDSLFARQADIGRLAWGEFGVLAGVKDTASLRTCMTSDSVRLEVNASAALAAQLHIQHTPTVILNGVRLFHTPTGAELRRIIRDANGAT